MDWRNGFSARYYATVVDPDSWKDGERIELTGGSIRKVYSDLRESADLNCRNYFDTKEQIIRVWLDTRQNSNSSHIALFTGLSSSPNANINGRVESGALNCHSVLKPARDILLPRGWYAPVETDAVKLIRDLLKVTKAPITIDDSMTNGRKLKQSIIAESGETNMSMVEKLLVAINWRLRINGLGEISVEPYNSVPVAIFDSTWNDVVEPSITVKHDWYECPNCIRVVFGEEVATYKDSDSDTPLSISGRGREIWVEETNVVLNDHETLNEYAKRRLKEYQRVSTTVTYNRRSAPDIIPTDVISLNYPLQKLVGDYMVTSQTITLGFGAKVNEEVVAI